VVLHESIVVSISFFHLTFFFLIL